VIVLACTHYPFLVDRCRRLAPWPVTWIDPAPAIARRVASVVGEAVAGSGLGRAYLTSGQSWPAALAPTLAAIGLIS
jgi:glutamate racemase